MPTESQTTHPKRDQFWNGVPRTITAWAALNRSGEIMAASVRDRPEDVRLACGECVPIQVTVSYLVGRNEDPAGCAANSCGYAEDHPANEDMVDGFLDGYDLSAPEPSANRSHSYRHGFANGRDDRSGKPRAGVDELRRMANLAMELDRNIQECRK